MKVLFIHNYYRERGGEDEMADADASLLTDNGHEVVKYCKSNKQLFSGSLFHSWTTVAELSRLIELCRPDVAHIHNLFYAITPSVYDVLDKYRIPSVHTLHNYRFCCANGLLYRERGICEACVGTAPLRALFRRCWDGSLLKTTALVPMLISLQNKLKTPRPGRRFQVLSEFSRGIFVRAGLPAASINVRPNWIDPVRAVADAGEYVIFVGRLAGYKGIRTLLEAYRQPGLPVLKIIGDGPLASLVERSVAPGKIEWLGRCDRNETLKYIAGARALIAPSECYENMPRTVLESFACGVPVVASDRGVFPEMVAEAGGGILFRCGDAADLADKIRFIMNDRDCRRMTTANARKAYELNYTRERGYSSLIGLYERCIAETDCFTCVT